MENWAQGGDFFQGCTHFCVSGLDINDCVLSYLEGTALISTMGRIALTRRSCTL